MSGKVFECGYGAIVQEDVEVLEACLHRIAEFRIGIGGMKICEIGAHAGATARGIKRWCDARQVKLTYYGIDPVRNSPGRIEPPFDGENLIIGDSAEVASAVPDGIDLLWIDGCHCRNHVTLDILNYGPKVAHGGFICFHDVNPRYQGHDYQGHGPNLPEFCVGVWNAIQQSPLHDEMSGWSLFMEKVPTDINTCGTRAYQRL